MKPKFSVRLLLTLVTCSAFFFAGWIARETLLLEESEPTVEPRAPIPSFVGDIVDQHSLARKQAPPNVDGVVLRIGSNGNFVAKFGADNGIRVDDVLGIYRLDRFIGKGTVVKTKDNLCVVKPVEDSMEDLVREGDHLAN